MRIWFDREAPTNDIYADSILRGPYHERGMISKGASTETVETGLFMKGSDND